MSTDSDASHLQGFLARRAGDGADSALIAAALSATLQDLDAELSPVIGSKGMAALLRRSLQLTGSTLADQHGLPECAQEPLAPSCLLAFLGQRTPQDALSLGEQLLQTLYRLLGTLIGHPSPRAFLMPYSQLRSARPRRRIVRHEQQSDNQSSGHWCTGPG